MKRYKFFIISLFSVFFVTAQNTSDSVTLILTGKDYKHLEKHFIDKINAQKRQTDWAQFYCYKAANNTVKQPVKAVFMGNSITDNWVKYHSDFFIKNNFVGRGISGQTTSQMLVRFQSDVIDLKPKFTVILAGINDIFCNNGRISLHHILQNIQSMCELAEYHKITPVLCSVLPVYQYKNWTLRPADDIILLNKMIKEYADNHEIIYVDFHSEMKDKQNGLLQNLTNDGVHPAKEGYAIMEEIFFKNIRKLMK